MVNIETDPFRGGQEIAAKAVRDLDLLQASLTIDTLKEKPEPDEILSAAISNLNFVNEQISPLVEDFYGLRRLRLQFGYGFRLSSLSPAGIRLITYNYPEVPNRLGIAFAPERRPAELTEDMLARLYSGMNPNAVEGLGKPSKEQIIAKFKQHISSNK